MNRTAAQIERVLTEIQDKLRWPAAVLLFLMALLTTVDVIGRYVFSKPIKGNIDIQEMMMVLIIFLGVGYCTIKERQTNADVLISRLPKRTRAITGTVTWFLCTVTFGLIAWQITRWGIGELISPTRATYLLAIKQGPYIMVAALGCILVCISSLVNFFRYLAQAQSLKESK